MRYLLLATLAGCAWTNTNLQHATPEDYARERERQARLHDGTAARALVEGSQGYAHTRTQGAQENATALRPAPRYRTECTTDRWGHTTCETKEVP